MRTGTLKILTCMRFLCEGLATAHVNYLSFSAILTRVHSTEGEESVMRLRDEILRYRELRQTHASLDDL